ncbi:glycosyltransferase family 4 protein [Methylomagnum sp.]
MNVKAKIILVTRNFPPMRGGMERLNYHIYEALGQEYEIYLVGPLGAEEFCLDTCRVKVSSALPVWRFLILAFWQTLTLARTLRPQLIFAGSGVAAFPAVLVGRALGIPVITYLHGLDIIAPHPIYQKIFIPIIRRSSAWLVNSRFTQQAAIKAGIPASDISIINPGTNLPDLPYSDGGNGFRQRVQAGDRPILLSVGRLTRRKGLLEFIEYALPEIVRQCPQVLLVIIGSEPKQSVAISSEIIADKIRELLAKLGLEANAKLLGDVDEMALAGAYAASQLHVFPVLDLPGDVEGFGMVAIEAAAHGVPTVAFDVGGIADAVGTGLAGALLPSGDYAGLSQAVAAYLRGDNSVDEVQTKCRCHAEKFAWEFFGDALRSAVHGIIAEDSSFVDKD